MTLEHFIKDYGYWAVLMGSMIEGESIILTASALAALGHLSILKIAMITFMGTLVADQGIYFLGVFYGKRSLTFIKEKVSFLHPHIEKGLLFLNRNQTAYLLSFRFIYGIRIISPFIIGSQGVSFPRFAIFNVIAAFIWTVISCAVGYFLGRLIEPYIQHVGLIVTCILGGFLIVGWLLHRRKKR